MAGLTYIWGAIRSKIFRYATFNLVRSVEYGVINSSMNLTLGKVVVIGAKILKIQSLQTALGSLLVGSFFLLLIG